ncbi:MAG: putative rane protein [Frankiales bacterium]|nr:putative rane protein [Frankiales bacterium]
MTSAPGGDDELFQRIVADFAKETDEPIPRWPVAEDITDPSRAAAAVEPAAPSRDLTPPAVEPLPAWLEPEALDDDGHYQPPPAPRIPIPHARTLLATAMLLLGLTVMFAPFRIGLDDSTPFLLMGLALTCGGAAMLVLGMRDAPPTDSGPDDGAVV